MIDADDAIAAIRRLAPVIEAEKAAFDRNRELSPRVVAAMHEIGLFSLWLPRELNGPALNLKDSAGALEKPRSPSILLRIR